MPSELAQRECEPCKGSVPPMPREQAQTLLAMLGGNWQVIAGHHLWKAYDFQDFVSALAFVNRAGAVAESQGHHPDLLLRYGRVEVSVWTHKIDGLTASDFILAAKLDAACATPDETTPCPVAM